MTNRKPKILISGGGTGGHIFPAISIAQALRQEEPGTEILFVGAAGRMEMEKVPAAGFRIESLPVIGLHRKKVWKNVQVAMKLIHSLRKAEEIIRRFSPDVVVGVGGYASGPTLRRAANMGIPTLIQEQNSYAGLTNRWLARKARTICVAYEGMEKFFPAEKIVLTGNPVRLDITGLESKKAEGLSHFGLSPKRPVVLLLGGSLGARTLNRAMLKGFLELTRAGYQVLWQTGSLYGETIRKEIGEDLPGGLVILDFISRMDLAYAAADLIISRAGAGTISELCLAGKPVILVPSPNVAEDHQTSNAMALVKKNAGLLLKDAEAEDKLTALCLELLASEARRQTLAGNIRSLALPGAAAQIAAEILKLVETKEA